jgi:hypothetical protein
MQNTEIGKLTRNVMSEYKIDKIIVIAKNMPKKIVWKNTM